MDIKRVVAKPSEGLVYLERYVNDGSPSGFTALHRTSPATDPYGLHASFSPFALFDELARFQTFGTDTHHPILQDGMIFIHPDMAHHAELRGSDVRECPDIQVTPTSSARTVQVMSARPHDYIKLFYDGLVGRNNRRLHRIKAIAGPELSALLSTAIESGDLPAYLTILREPFSRIHRNPDNSDPAQDWAMVWREGTPTGSASPRIHWMAPLFSLWSRDRLRPEDPPLIEQLWTLWGGKAEDVMLSLLTNLIDIHFTLITKLGLQFEFNAQNVLLGLDAQCNIESIVLRDMMDIEKDLVIRRSLGLHTDFASHPYHVLGVEDQDFARQRRSFEPPQQNLWGDSGSGSRPKL